MLTLNLSINKFFISLPSSFQRSLKKIRCLQNLLGTEWKIPYLMCYLPVWVRDNWKDLTNRNNSMEGSVQNIKKKSPDEVQLTEDTATLLKLQSEVASNCAVVKWSQAFTWIIWGVLMLKTSTAEFPQLAQILSKTNFVPGKKWLISGSPSGAHPSLLHD